MNGKAHAATSGNLAPYVGATLGLLSGDARVGALAAAGCVLGIIMSPDLDVDHRTLSENVLLRNPVTWPLGFAWWLLWLPYALIPHRSPISHAPVASTALRILYLLLMLSVARLLLPFGPLTARLTDAAWLWRTAPQLWALWLGLAASDVAHAVSDGW